MFYKSLSIASIGLFLFGCSSAPKNANSENTPDRVVSRINEMSSRPSWLLKLVESVPRPANSPLLLFVQGIVIGKKLLPLRTLATVSLNIRSSPR